MYVHLRCTLSSFWTEFISPWHWHLPSKLCCPIQSSLLRTLYTENSDRPNVHPSMQSWVVGKERSYTAQNLVHREGEMTVMLFLARNSCTQNRAEWAAALSWWGNQSHESHFSGNSPTDIVRCQCSNVGFKFALVEQICTAQLHECQEKTACS
jgi:hypothetical protein